MHHSKSVAMLVITVVGLCGIGFAESTPVVYHYDTGLNNQVTTNTCSVSEPVALNGNIHFQYSFTTDDNGVNHFSISAANNLTGSGQKTGVSYTAADSNDYTVNSADNAAEVTVTLKSDLVPQAQLAAPSLLQQFHISLDTSGNVSAEVLSNNTSCGSE